MKNIFKTPNNNHYLYRSHENKVVFIHPLIHFFFNMEENGMNPVDWIQTLQGPDVNIENLGVFNIKDVRYYFQKYNLLKGKNYFKKAKEEQQFLWRLTPYDIEYLLTCSKEVIFEVTKACNLACRYCIQGDLYQIHEKDQKLNIDTGKAKVLLDYLCRYWERSSSPGLIGIKFYGGEPLMNFNAVKEIVDYAKTFAGFREKFYFKITTNGVLLDRYLDYLVNNNIYVAVSLDGDKDNSSHRVFANGEPVFEKVTANINMIRDKYASYFETNVSFQAVLHSRNSITGIHDYIGKTYGKQPFMTEMTRVNLNKDRKKEFDTIYKNIYNSLFYGEDYPLLEENKLKELPRIPSGIIAHNVYNLLLKNMDEPVKNEKKKTPTGTCHPFSKGIFLATDGKILPCERIEHKFAFGYINDNDEVVLDFKAIAERFNRYYDNMSSLCSTCSNANFCGRCMFSCKVDENKPVCIQYCDRESFFRRLSQDIGYMEDKPGILYKHITEI
jgi:uncharacterized protein